jgi:hypothetical protein
MILIKRMMQVLCIFAFIGMMVIFFGGAIALLGIYSQGL